MKTFIVFKKQKWEKVNSYSVVDTASVASIPANIVQAKKLVEDKLYTKEELEKMRNDLCK